ncbi:MAG: galactose oxidase [Prolixibacteraceae bacterium]|nr:galactose oxidase [Prolixibacteraceae bacterium]
MKINYLLLLLFAFSLGFTSCSDDDDEELMGNWWKKSGLDGVARSDAVGFVLDSKFYIGTGYDGDDRLTDFWVYDPDNDYWTQLSDFPGAARNGAVGMSINGKGYIGTGFDGEDALKDFYEYDPSAKSWTRIDDFPGDARYGAAAFAIDDKGYVGTGCDDLFYKDFYAYSPSSQSWENIISLGGDKRRDAAAFVLDGIGYIISGYNNASYETDVWAYDPSTGYWTEKRHITNYTDEKYDNDYSNIARMNGSAFTVNGKGYLTCGSTGSLVSNVWEYDPQMDLWEERTAFEGAARTEAVGFSIGSKGYIVTGRSSGYYLYDLWCFDPTAEQVDND